MSSVDSVEKPKVNWHLLRPRVVKLINSVSAENLNETTQRFVELGFPWQDAGVIDALAKLFVSASASHGFYAHCYGLLASALNHSELALSTGTGKSDSCASFLTAVKAALTFHFSTVLSEMSLLGNGSAATTSPTTGYIFCAPERKTRDRLVNSCKLAASLHHLGAYSLGDLRHVLQLMGLLNTVNVRQASVASATQESTPQQEAMPMVSMLSGNCPSAQPTCGETMAAWRERLAFELKFPAERLGLLAGNREVSANEPLDHFEGPLQVLVRRVHMKEEYRIEAGCTLLSKAMADLIASVDGRALLKGVVDDWEQLGQQIPKRAQFMIMDLKWEMAGHGPVANYSQFA